MYITIANKTILTKTSFLAIVAVGTLCYLSNLSTYPMVTSADTSDTENEEIKFCQENRYQIHPRALRHGNGRFLFEVNGTEKINYFVQLVEVIMCKEGGTECGVDDMRSRRRRTVCPRNRL